MTGVRVTMQGTAEAAMRLRHELDDAGYETRFIGPPPLEQRGAGQEVLQWIGIYVAEKVVDASLGRPVERTARAAVDRVVAGFKSRYPHIRISVDND
jgi:hypothetical protein